MSIKQRLADEMKAALKAGEKDRLAVIRMLKARVQEAEVNARAKQGKDHEIGDEEAVDVLAGYAKQRRESIESYRKAGRDDLALKEERELAVIQEYLPEQLSEEEIRSLVKRAVAESGASSPRDLGAVMKLLMPEVKGRADGKLVNRLVREAIEAGG